MNAQTLEGPLSRRRVLAAAMGGATWLLVGCNGYRGAARGVAFKPFELAGNEDRPEWLAASAAVLAASPHNTQPWRLRVTPQAIDVFADPARWLGAMDSLRRELFIGLGCAIENAVLTASAHGRRVDVAYLPDPAAPDHAARLTLVEAAPRPSPLEQVIVTRRTNRFPYAERAVPQTLLAALPEVVEDPRVRLLVVTDPEQRRQLRDDSTDAVVAITQDPEMAEASHRWWRQTQAEIDAHRDGLNLDGLGLDPTTRWFAGTYSTVSTETANRYWVDAVRGRHSTGSGYLLLLSRDRRSVEQQLATGRAWQRLALHLCAAGVDTHPLNMLPEMMDREETTEAPRRPFSQRCARWSGPEGGLQLLARFGYAVSPAFRSARRSLDEVRCETTCVAAR